MPVKISTFLPLLYAAEFVVPWLACKRRRICTESRASDERRLCQELPRLFERRSELLPIARSMSSWSMRRVLHSLPLVVSRSSRAKIKKKKGTRILPKASPASRPREPQQIIFRKRSASWPLVLFYIFTPDLSANVASVSPSAAFAMG